MNNINIPIAISAVNGVSLIHHLFTALLATLGTFSTLGFTNGRRICVHRSLINRANSSMRVIHPSTAHQAASST